MTEARLARCRRSSAGLQRAFKTPAVVPVDKSSVADCEDRIGLTMRAVLVVRGRSQRGLTECQLTIILADGIVGQGCPLSSARGRGRRVWTCPRNISNGANEISH